MKMDLPAPKPERVWLASYPPGPPADVDWRATPSLKLCRRSGCSFARSDARPRRIEFLEELPPTPIGKVLRRQLKDEAIRVAAAQESA